MDDCEWIAGNALNEENLHFHINFLVKSLLRHLVQSQSFSIGIIKRGISRFFITTGVTSHRPAPLYKPNALDALQMYDSQLFQSGFIKLNPSSSGCSCCLPHLVVQKSCYFSSMLRCIEYGWHIPFLSCLYPAVAITSLLRCVELRFSTPSIPPP